MIQGTGIHSVISLLLAYRERCCKDGHKKNHGPLPAIISVTFSNSEPHLVTGWL